MDYPWSYKKNELSSTIKRNIKRKEKLLGRTCRMIFEFTNPNGDKYLFAHFCKNYDKLIVTIGYFNPHIHRFLSVY